MSRMSVRRGVETWRDENRYRLAQIAGYAFVMVACCTTAFRLAFQRARAPALRPLSATPGSRDIASEALALMAASPAA
jgi:hypothetical protein